MSTYVDIVHIRTPKELGAAARRARLDLGMTQAELSERIGATRAWVSAFENGKTSAELGLALRALAALDLVADIVPAGPRHGGVDLDTLFGSSDA